MRYRTYGLEPFDASRLLLRRRLRRPRIRQQALILVPDNRVTLAGALLQTPVIEDPRRRPGDKKNAAEAAFM